MVMLEWTFFVRRITSLLHFHSNDDCSFSCIYLVCLILSRAISYIFVCTQLCNIDGYLAMYLKSLSRFCAGTSEALYLG